MNLSEARDIVREDFIDTVEGEGFFAGTIRDTALNRYINEAQVEACKRWNILFDADTSAVVDITLAEDTRAYDIHAKITKVVRAEYYDSVNDKHYPLEQKSYDYIERMVGSGWRTTTGKPMWFAIRNRKMYLYPVPGEDEDSETLSMEVYRLPLAVLSDDDDEFEVPEQYQQDLLYWAAHRVFHRADEELNDPTGTQYFLAQFERVFGGPISAQTLVHQLENPSEVTFEPVEPLSAYRDDSYTEDRIYEGH